MTTKSQMVYEAATVDAQEIILSSDSHIMEPSDFWATRVPEEYRDRLPAFSSRAGGDQPGGVDHSIPSDEEPALPPREHIERGTQHEAQ